MVNVYSLMGGFEIRVPDGVDVQVSKFAFMGGHEVRLGSEARRHRARRSFGIRLIVGDGRRRGPSRAQADAAIAVTTARSR